MNQAAIETALKGMEKQIALIRQSIAAAPSGDPGNLRAHYRDAIQSIMSTNGRADRHSSSDMREVVGAKSEQETNLFAWALVDLQGKSPLRLTPVIKRVGRGVYQLA